MKNKHHMKLSFGSSGVERYALNSFNVISDKYVMFRTIKMENFTNSSIEMGFIAVCG